MQRNTIREDRFYAVRNNERFIRSFFLDTFLTIQFALGVCC